MRETERVRIMEKMRERVRKRKRIRMLVEGLRERMEDRRLRCERDLMRKMAFVVLNPLQLTIFRLVYSVRVSMDPRSREFLIFAGHGVNEALELVKSLEEFRDHVDSKKMEALEGEINEAALKLENVLDSQISLQFLSQCELERQPLLFSLNLRGIEQDIDGFLEKVMKMEKLLNPWLEQEEDDSDSGGKESDILGLSNQSEVDVIKSLFISWFPEEEDSDPGRYGVEKEFDILGLSEVDVSRSWFISWFAAKAASIFTGMKEGYIQDLENLLPPEDGDYAVLFTTDRTTDFSRMVPVKHFRYINVDLMIWWINKAAASLIFAIEEEDDDVVVSLGTEPSVNMVGSTHLYCKIRDYLLEDFKRLKIARIIGMAGIGKTALAKKIIQDPLILSKFECCIFVRIGPKYELEEILQAILAQMPDGDKMLMQKDVSLCHSVYEILRVRKYLIVFDDFWNRGPWNILDLFPWDCSQIAVLLTTRLTDFDIEVRCRYKERFYQVPFMNNEESWDLLRGKIFGEERCPPELEKAGKKIAENCEGLPLLILAVAGLLSQVEKTPEYWRKVAASKTNSIFVDAYEQVQDVVYPSYHYLPQHLKPCFLYLAAFPQNDEFRVSRLISVWSADGFLGVPYTRLQKHADNLLKDLVSNNIVLDTQWSTVDRRLKGLSLHSVFWYLCKREARKEKFLHVLNSYTDASVQGVKSQRRLSIYKNTILSIKDARDSIASISALHSLLCMGPYHQYEVPICLGLKFLKVLDALTIRLYEFPIEVVKLVQLRYLALTCNGNLPPSISKLWGLQCLILDQHQSIKFPSVSHSYLPVEIWDLLELEHLQINGRNLSEPPPSAVLRKLVVLLDVGAHTCTERVLASIPNLQKLRVQIELMPLAVEPLRFCDDISLLKALRSLQFVVVNPELKFDIISPDAALGSFSYLKRLTLSGFGYSWKDMHKIAHLSRLEVLKLKCYAFRGEKWQVKQGEFWMLKYLLIEDSDLVQWTGFFQFLEILTIKNCYKLLELPQTSSSSIKEIRVVDCNPSAVTCAKQKKTERCRVYVDSSWLGDRKLS